MHVVDTAQARQLATAAQVAGAVVRAGPLRHPSAAGRWQLGDVDLSEYLAQHRDQQVLLIVAPVENGAVILCQVCAYPLDAAGSCPRCALRSEVVALRRIIDAALRMREVEEHLAGLDKRTY